MTEAAPIVVSDVADVLRSSAPAWLSKAWAGAERRGVDALTPAEIEVEIDARRAETHTGNEDR